jgi:hypothetical protein
MPQKEDQSIKLLRHQLGSIDLEDLSEEKEMSEADRESYCAQIFAVFSLIEKDIKKMLYQQLMFSANNTEDWGQVLFSRGTFNGMYLLLEQWKKAFVEYQDKHKIEKEVNKNNPLPEL